MSQTNLQAKFVFFDSATLAYATKEQEVIFDWHIPW